MKRKKLTAAQRKRLHGSCNGMCAYCGCKLQYEKMQIDHIQPLSNGGADELKNMLPACRSCNHRKNSESLENYRKSVENFLNVLSRDSVTYRNAVRYGLLIPNPHPVTFYFEKLKMGDENDYCKICIKGICGFMLCLLGKSCGISHRNGAKTPTFRKIYWRFD